VYTCFMFMFKTYFYNFYLYIQHDFVKLWKKMKGIVGFCKNKSVKYMLPK
jgi:hypothetical protein